jgi:hypothetical protein
MPRLNVCLVTYAGNWLCEVEEQDVGQLNEKEPGVFVMLYNVFDADSMDKNNPELLFLERNIETSTIVSRLF